MKVLIIIIVIIYVITISVVGKMAPGAEEGFTKPGQFMDSYINGFKTKNRKVIVLGTLNIFSLLALIIWFILTQSK